MRHSLLTTLLLTVLLAGCGGSSTDEGPELIPATGTVNQAGKPLADADVAFIPTGTTPGQGGTGRTDAEGKFAIVSWTGDAGVPAGEYRVTVSRRLNPDGTPVPADDETPPIESPAKESLPAKYSNADQTQLTATVSSNPAPIEIRLD